MLQCLDGNFHFSFLIVLLLQSCHRDRLLLPIIQDDCVKDKERFYIHILQLRKQSASQCSILFSPEHMYRYSVLSSLLHLPSDPSQSFTAITTTPLEIPSYWRSVKCASSPFSTVHHFSPFSLHCCCHFQVLPFPMGLRNPNQLPHDQNWQQTQLDYMFHALTEAQNSSCVSTSNLLLRA